MTARVRRDPLGVPHLWADDVIELARLQGRVAALDRAWQIEHHRWRMEGRTAEQLGVEGLDWDRFARQVRLEHTVRRCFDNLDPETREWLTAYVDGVNSTLAEGLSKASEVRALGLEAYAANPRPWQPWTPLGIFWGIHLLFGTFPAKLFNAHVAERLGPHVVPLLRTEGSDRSGSNAWVAAGHRTASGLPLVAGDPHRTIELPGCYQQVGLACPELDVVGFTFPGVPGVQHFAHTGTVAWGITNAMADYQDLTTESLRVTGRDASGGSVVEARGVRGWAIRHPHDYALIYGSPVPGYAAPQSTIEPATQAVRVLLDLLTDMQSHGAVPEPVPVPRALQRTMAAFREFGAGLSDDLLLRAAVSWSGLVGTISLELFGHFVGVFDDPEIYFEDAIHRLAVACVMSNILR